MFGSNLWEWGLDKDKKDTTIPKNSGAAQGIGSYVILFL
jgi:hypothetical protein